MRVIYILSILVLISSFLLYFKKNEKLSIVSQFFYTICFFFCYQTFAVCFLSYFHLGGSIIYFSLFNFIVAIVMLFISIKSKKIQKYYFDKKELLLFLLVVGCLGLVVLYRFRGFNAIPYASDDAAIHYRASFAFSQVLGKLTTVNYHDVIFKDFGGMMPMFYINGGMFIYLFSFISSYRAFLIYDGICFVLYTLLFLVTLLRFVKKEKYVYLFVITMLYGLGFPLNNLIYGFGYLGCGIMTINLILDTMLQYGDNINDNVLFKVIVLFILSFSIFFSYYLFMPFIYLALGIYYMVLCKKNKIMFTRMCFYGVITLIIPFIIGFITYFCSGFGSVSNVLSAVSLNGDIYHNITPILFFFLVGYYFFYSESRHKKKLDFFLTSFIILSIYVLFFFFLYITKVVSFYYFYKLFYVYWVFSLLYLGVKLEKRKVFIYLFFWIVLLGSFYVLVDNSMSKYSILLSRFNVYYYNAINYGDMFIRFNKDELKVIDKALKNRDICSYDDEFIAIENTYKNMWFYSIIGSVPVLQHVPNDREQLYSSNINFSVWEKSVTHPCVVIFYEGKGNNYDFGEYDIIFENKSGVLLKRNS